MSKIQLIEECIANAEKRISKLTPDALMVPALSSLNIRHLMNNLGAICTNYLEVGVHKGGLFCSTLFKNENIKFAYAIDNWASDENVLETAFKEFHKNQKEAKCKNTITVISRADAFADKVGWVTPMLPIDLYLYDAGHSEEDQYMALAHYIPFMADEFIFCVDDYDWDDVRNGTERGIKETGVEVLFSNVWKGNDHDNEGAWNGFAVFLLKKKP